jgi:hypothetical protein
MGKKPIFIEELERKLPEQGQHFVLSFPWSQSLNPGPMERTVDLVTTVTEHERI